MSRENRKSNNELDYLCINIFQSRTRDAYSKNNKDEYDANIFQSRTQDICPIIRIAQPILSGKNKIVYTESFAFLPKKT